MTAKRAGIGLNITLIILVCLSLYPIFFMVSNALKSGAQSANPFTIEFAEPFGINFSNAWQYLTPSFTRSVFIVVISVIGIILFALLSAFSFARLKFPGKNVLFFIIFALLLVPGFLTLIPLFLEIDSLGLLGSNWGLILPYIAGGQAFAIFVFRTSIEGLPEEIFEAARMDGAHELHMFFRIVVPLTVPIMVTIALLNINSIWGDYIFPSLILDPMRSTVAVTIASFQPPPELPNIDAPNMQLAAFTIASVPIVILYLFLMRYFVEGITSGGIKM